MSRTTAHASSTEWATPGAGHVRPIFSIAALKSARSSAFAIDVRARAEHLDAEPFEHALVAELHREVERRSARRASGRRRAGVRAR